jgi:hypothetical protein
MLEGLSCSFTVHLYLFLLNCILAVTRILYILLAPTVLCKSSIVSGIPAIYFDVSRRHFWKFWQVPLLFRRGELNTALCDKVC